MTTTTVKCEIEMEREKARERMREGMRERERKQQREWKSKVANGLPKKNDGKFKSKRIKMGTRK